MTACFAGRSGCTRRRRLISEMTSTPLITATPNSEMNPTAADTLRLMPRRYSDHDAADERERHVHQHQPGVVAEPNVKNSSAKIMAIVIGRMNAQPLPRAREVLELPAPVHAVPGGSLTCASNRCCASATKPP